MRNQRATIFDKRAFMREPILGTLGILLIVLATVSAWVLFTTNEAQAETTTLETDQWIQTHAVLEQFLQTPVKNYYKQDEVGASRIVEAEYSFLTSEYKTDELAKQLGAQGMIVRELIVRMQYGLGVKVEREGVLDKIFLSDAKMMLEILKLRAGLLNEILGNTWRFSIEYPDDESIVLNGPGFFHENRLVVETLVQTPTPGKLIKVRLAVPKKS
ncbi:TPA: hypothetical protein HA249_00215 [Candidatus Woesearchaeota archaeon]|nr:MAG: hypothetical protein QT07_C0007G0040 [archaeon GW2011_AR16]HIG95301.1 hypothetical protein [Candidatus Woesearchaeota archaeon]HIH47109.1 hypothetical protein [Candidatus Woesearchaeota archaeon]HII89319.1 hypothetical protein [Candidatus Woesearchaeota archaeon]